RWQSFWGPAFAAAPRRSGDFAPSRISGTTAPASCWTQAGESPGGHRDRMDPRRQRQWRGTVRRPGGRASGGPVSEVSDLSKSELSALARAVELWDELLATLGKVEAYPAGNSELHIETELQPGYLGWIGYNEGGVVTFHPASKPE